MTDERGETEEGDGKGAAESHAASEAGTNRAAEARDVPAPEVSGEQAPGPSEKLLISASEERETEEAAGAAASAGGGGGGGGAGGGGGGGDGVRGGGGGDEDDRHDGVDGHDGGDGDDRLGGGDGVPPASSHPQSFIFGRELAEVYLLLDNVSTSANKALPEPAKDDPLFGADANGGKATNWLEQICEIGWPPRDSPDERAKKAAKLVRARDLLNQAAAPATGASIAFTLLVAGEDAMLRQRHDDREPSWWARALLAAAGYDHQAPPPQATFGLEWPWEGWKKEPPSRAALASMAFPSLARRARSFRTWIIFLVILLIFWLVITCRLSWDVATGNALLTQFTTAQVASDDIRNKILDAQAPSIGVPPGTTRTPGGTQAAPAGVLSPSQYCSGAEDDNADSSDEHSGNKAASATAGSGVAATTGGSDATHQRLCVNRKQANRNYRLAQSNLQAWMQPGNRFMVRWFVGGYFDLGREITSQARLGTDRAAKPADLDEQWAAVWLAILGGVVLPIFYGVLGAGAAVVRNLSFKMRDSLLAPRDLTLSWVRLVLGAVIGGCVGLFISPSGSAADNPSLLGTVHLSAAALCFIAGFGVEAVFQALEGLISRAFNTGDASRK